MGSCVSGAGMRVRHGPISSVRRVTWAWPGMTGFAAGVVRAKFSLCSSQCCGYEAIAASIGAGSVGLSGVILIALNVGVVAYGFALFLLSSLPSGMSRAGST